MSLKKSATSKVVRPKRKSCTINLTLGNFFLEKINETIEVKSSLFLNLLHAFSELIHSDETEPVGRCLNSDDLAFSDVTEHLLNCILTLRKYL